MYKHLGLFTSRAPFTHYTCLWTIFISIVCPFTGYLDHLVLISNGEATSQPFSTIPSSSPVTINLALHGRSLHCCPLAPFIPCSFWFLTFWCHHAAPRWCSILARWCVLTSSQLSWYFLLNIYPSMGCHNPEYWPGLTAAPLVLFTRRKWIWLAVLTSSPPSFVFHRRRWLLQIQRIFISSGDISDFLTLLCM